MKSPKKQKDKNDKSDKKSRIKSYRKRNTIANDKSFFKKSLFGSREVRVDSRISTVKQLNLNIIEIDDDEPNKRAKEKNKEKKRKISSSRVLKQIISIKEEKIFDNSNKKKNFKKNANIKREKRKQRQNFVRIKKNEK